MQQYFLAPGVYMCLTEDQAVMLDLKRDKYLGLGQTTARALGVSIRGWPTAAGNLEDAQAHAHGVEPLIRKMLESGLLTTDPIAGREATPAVLEPATTALVMPSLEGDPPIRLRHLPSIIRAFGTATLALRRRPIEAVVSQVRARKAREARGFSAADLVEARELVRDYLRVRPLLFGARERCLLDSLALVKYLSYHGIHPTWVFGVRTGPFAAHSWVQHESSVFNDMPEHVRRFTPILTI